MSADLVRYIIAALTISICLWILGRGFYMKARSGVNALAVGLVRRAKKWNPVFREPGATTKDSIASGDFDLSPDAIKGAGWTERALIVTAVVLEAYILLRAPFPALVRLVLASPPPAPSFAIALLVLGALIMITAQLGMGASWGIGVPQGRNGI